MVRPFEFSLACVHSLRHPLPIPLLQAHLCASQFLQPVKAVTVTLTAHETPKSMSLAHANAHGTVSPIATVCREDWDQAQPCQPASQPGHP